MLAADDDVREDSLAGRLSVGRSEYRG